MTLLAITVLGWILRGAVALVAMIAIYVVGAGILRKFQVEPDAEPNPDRVVPVNVRFRCIVCGAEVVMTAAQGGGEIEPPRHCREDMVPV